MLLDRRVRDVWRRERRAVLRPSARRYAVPFLISVALAAVGLWLALGGGHDASARQVGWLNVAFFGLGALVLGAQFLPGVSGLVLDPQGFTLRTLGRARRFAWADVEGFQVGVVGGQVLVLFDCPGDHGRLARANRALFGASHALPHTFGLPPTDLAAFMALLSAHARPPT